MITRLTTLILISAAFSAAMPIKVSARAEDCGYSEVRSEQGGPTPSSSVTQVVRVCRGLDGSETNYFVSPIRTSGDACYFRLSRAKRSASDDGAIVWEALPGRPIYMVAPKRNACSSYGAPAYAATQDVSLGISSLFLEYWQGIAAGIAHGEALFDPGVFEGPEVEDQFLHGVRSHQLEVFSIGTFLGAYPPGPRYEAIATDADRSDWSVVFDVGRNGVQVMAISKLIR